MAIDSEKPRERQKTPRDSRKEKRDRKDREIE